MTCSSEDIFYFQCCYKEEEISIVVFTEHRLEFQMSIEELFPELFSSSVKQMSLSLLYDGFKLEKGFTVSLKPMELYSFVLQR